MKKYKKSPPHEQTRNSVFIPVGRGRALAISGQLDVARCPLCDGSMTARMNKHGPYFHCRCHEKN